MTVKELSVYRQQLEDMARRLGARRTEHKQEGLQPTGAEPSGGISSAPLHLADLGSQEFERNMTLGLVASEEHLIEQVNDALERIDLGAYGTCETCGGRIPVERLQALPYARQCVVCARASQRGGNS